LRLVVYSPCAVCRSWTWFLFACNRSEARQNPTYGRTFASVVSNLLISLWRLATSASSRLRIRSTLASELF
jgi:hypothetical protein